MCLLLNMWVFLVINPFIHLFIDMFIQFLVIHSFIHSFVHSCVHSFIFVASAAQCISYLHTFIHSFIHLFVHSFVHSFILCCTWCITSLIYFACCISLSRCFTWQPSPSRRADSQNRPGSVRSGVHMDKSKREKPSAKQKKVWYTKWKDPSSENSYHMCGINCKNSLERILFCVL